MSGNKSRRACDTFPLWYDVITLAHYKSFVSKQNYNNKHQPEKKEYVFIHDKYYEIMEKEIEQSIVINIMGCASNKLETQKK